MTALLETEALFITADGQLRGAPRDPDLIITLECTLRRVLDLTVPDLYADLGVSGEELVSVVPSRFVLNARNEETPTQQLGSACFRSGRVSALNVPSAANPKGTASIFCLKLFVGDRVAILDKSGHLKGQIKGLISISAHRPLSFLQRIKLQGCNAGQRDRDKILD
jgi:hypothetical protein